MLWGVDCSNRWLWSRDHYKKLGNADRFSADLPGGVFIKHKPSLALKVGFNTTFLVNVKTESCYYIFIFTNINFLWSMDNCFSTRYTTYEDQNVYMQIDASAGYRGCACAVSHYQYDRFWQISIYLKECHLYVHFCLCIFHIFNTSVHFMPFWRHLQVGSLTVGRKDFIYMISTKEWLQVVLDHPSSQSGNDLCISLASSITQQSPSPDCCLIVCM